MQALIENGHPSDWIPAWEGLHVVCDWRFGNLCGSHLQSKVIVLVSWKFKNLCERFDWSINRVAVGKRMMWLAVKKSWSTSSRTLQTIAQQETVTHCLLFILQPIHFHISSPHTSSQPIASRVYIYSSVANNSPSQDSDPSNDHFQSRYVSPGCKSFS